MPQTFLKNLTCLLLSLSLAIPRAYGSGDALPKVESVDGSATVGSLIPALKAKEGADIPTSQWLGLQRDFLSVSDELDRIGFFKDKNGKDEFLKWWQSTQIEFSTRAALSPFQNVTVQEFVALMYIRYCSDEYKKDGNAPRFVQRVSIPITNPIMSMAAQGATLIVVAALGFSLPILKGALTAGPVAGVVGAYLEPLVRPIREKVGTLGARHFGWLSKPLQRFLTKSKTAASATEDLKGKIHELRENQLSNEEMDQAWQDLRSKFIDYNQVWVEFAPPFLKDGRSVYMDAVVERHRNFGVALSTFDTHFETHRKLFQALQEAFVKNQGVTRSEIDEVLNLNRQLTLSRDLGGKSNFGLQAKRAEALKKLTDRGIAQDQVDLFLGHHAAMTISKSQASSAMADWILYEISYPDLGRKVHGENASDADFELLKSGMGYYHYLHKNLIDTQAVLTKLEVHLDLRTHEILRIQSLLASDPIEAIKMFQSLDQGKLTWDQVMARLTDVSTRSTTEQAAECASFKIDEQLDSP